MTKTVCLKCLEVLYEALASPLGIITDTTNANTAYEGLKFMRRSGDIRLRCIAIVPSPFQPNSEIWLVKRLDVEASMNAMEPADAQSRE